MKFMDAVKSVFSKYATFSGRARRSEYWYFFLFNFIVSFVLGLISSTVSDIWGLAVLIPSLAVAVRRLHDIGKSGKLMLIMYVPYILMLICNFAGLPIAGIFSILYLIGAIIMLVWYVKDSQPGDNAYGPNPKGVAGAAYTAPAAAPAADPWAVASEAPKAPATSPEEDDEFARLMKSFKTED